MKKLINFKRLVYFVFIVSAVVIIQSCVVYTPYSQQKVSVPDIVQMSKDGMSSKDIIAEIQQSRSVYGLKADQLAKLHDEGVQDSVLNYMEESHLNAVRRYSMADSYYGYGWDYGLGYGGLGFGWPYYGWGWGSTIILNSRHGFGGGFHGGFAHGGFHGGGRR
jgi:hypothetical protein